MVQVSLGVAVVSRASPRAVARMSQRCRAVSRRRRTVSRGCRDRVAGCRAGVASVAKLSLRVDMTIFYRHRSDWGVVIR